MIDDIRKVSVNPWILSNKWPNFCFGTYGWLISLTCLLTLTFYYDIKRPPYAHSFIQSSNIGVLIQWSIGIFYYLLQNGKSHHPTTVKRNFLSVFAENFISMENPCFKNRRCVTLTLLEWEGSFINF